MRQLSIEAWEAESRYEEEEWHSKLKFPTIFSNELKKRKGNKTQSGRKMSDPQSLGMQLSPFMETMKMTENLLCKAHSMFYVQKTHL